MLYVVYEPVQTLYQRYEVEADRPEDALEAVLNNESYPVGEPATMRPVDPDVKYLVIDERDNRYLL